jgi:hypothetical protein
MELTQNKLFNKREFKITDSKLFYSSTKFWNKNEFFISFEDIVGEKVAHVSTNSNLFIASITSFLMGILMVVLMLLVADEVIDVTAFSIGLGLTLVGVILFIVCKKTRESFWRIKLSDGRNLVFHQNIPDYNTTEKFIAELFKARNTFLRKNYMLVDKNLNYEGQLNTFRWLRSIQAITEEEFDNLYTELKETVNPLKNNIGFKD